MDLDERFISGFCRSLNRTNTVCCEYEEEDGKKELTFMDCFFENCEHHSSCLIYKEALGEER